MQLEHSFSVPVGVEEAWAILSDIDRIGPCLPGTAIDSVDGDEITGAVKVKLGPLNLNYRGKAVFLEMDEAARRAVLDANGSDARGHGTAAVKVTATLTADGDRATTVRVVTDLDLTGKPAKFGHGVMEDVGTKLLGQFADALTRTIPGASAAGEQSTGVPEPVASAAPDAAAVPEPERDPAPVAGSAAATAEHEPAPVLEPDLAELAPEQLAEVADDEETVLAYEETVLAYSVPDGLAADDPAQMVLDGRAPDGETGALDLLHFPRPAMAKRLAPVAVALVVVLIAARRRSVNRR